VTFNILHGRSPADGQVDVARFDRAVRSLDADILALQEVDRAQERSGRLDLTSVAADAMGSSDQRFVAALSGTPGAIWTAATGREQPDSAAYGVALLSRFPVRSWEVVRLRAIPGRVPFRAAGRWRLVSDEPRVALIAVVDGPDGPLTVATTHLSYLHGWNVGQLLRVTRALRRRAAPRILMGDLNMGLRAAERVARMRSAIAEPTYPADAPTRQLDHVLVDGLPGPFTGHVQRLELSDHRAVVVAL
jgi:endonuclease/exonuclease/phosphatase family metal-dependent hydrolase